MLHGTFADVQLPGNLAIGYLARKQRCDFKLARSQSGIAREPHPAAGNVRSRHIALGPNEAARVARFVDQRQPEQPFLSRRRPDETTWVVTLVAALVREAGHAVTITSTSPTVK
jgi:hypothetical protein